MPALSRPDRLTLAALLLFVSAVYFSSFIGVTSSNDGSHYALVRAIVDHRQFEISDYLSFTENQDYAIHDGRYYSDRPPGTALWASPFFALATVMPQPAGLPPSKHDPGNPHLLGVGAAAALAGALAVGVFWLLLRQHFGLGLAASTLAALALALGTPMWKYGSLLYSHSTSALTVLLSIYLALRLLRHDRPSLLLGLGFGAVLGLTVWMEYTNAVFIAIMVVFMLTQLGPPTWQAAGDDRRHWLLLWAAMALGGALAVGGLLGYNTLLFGGPFEFSTMQVDLERWPQNENLQTNFATPLLEGLVAMLWYNGDNFNQGLFLMAPVAWLSWLGLPALWRHSRRDAVLVLGVFAVFLLLFSKSTTYNPYTNDGRYLTPFLAFWFVPLAFWLDGGYRRVSGELPRALLNLGVFGLMWLSVRNAAMHIAFSWNHDLNPADLLPLSTGLPNVALILGRVFPNAANLWWLALLGLGAALVGGVAYSLSSRRSG